jgi:hypothetical protein
MRESKKSNTNLQENRGLKNMENKYLYGHDSQETAYVVDDYPWGFRLRTKIRYWIETKDASNGGQRFVSQTLNPKTNQWCAPKKSTYSPILVMFLNEDDHVKCSGLNRYNDLDVLNKFKESHLNNLSGFQKDQLKRLLATREVMQHVTFEFRSGISTIEESEKRNKENMSILRKIDWAISNKAAGISL